MLKVEVRVYDDVKKVTRDQYGKSVKNKAKNMRVHGKVKKSAVSHSKPVAKMHTEMAKMIDPGFRAGVV